ncbi:MAG: LCP family protein [Candidatus Limnocylindrales bacterium]|jgi:LCP family protein required for cell wall assembly
MQSKPPNTKRHAPVDVKPPNPADRRRSPSFAALLSFLWPGLGQLYVGKRLAAAIFAAPAVLILLLLAYAMRRGPVVFAAQLFADRTVGLAAVAILILVGVWRLAAVTHAFVGADRPRTRRSVERAVLTALAALIVVGNFGGSYYLLAYSNAGGAVFGNGNGDLIDQATPGPSLAPGQTSQPEETLPAPSPGGRVTILFTGVDAAPTRSEHLYDSIMVVSYDPKTNSVQMVSVPRDSASFPFYFGGVDSASTKINSIPTYVKNGWIKSPDSPYMTLVKEVSYLVGIPINYYAVMDLDGFVKMIDAVGGIDVVNPSVINDPSYDWLDGKTYGFYLAAGPQHLDGKHALAYVRSRHGSDNSDWKRASRQQQVLVALLHKMAQPSEILALPGLISTLGSSVTTTFPADQVADYVAIGQDVPSQNFSQVVLGPPYTVTGISSATASTCLLNAKVAALSIQLFGKDSLWYGKPAPANTCP